MNERRTNYQKIEIFSPAKVNLYLAVHGKLPNGYHALSTAIAPISLGDTIAVERTKSPGVTVSVEVIPELRLHLQAEGAFDADIAALSSSKNLAVRAAEELLTRTSSQQSFGLHIRIAKRVPLRAGLGGGSSNAAAVLRAVTLLLGGGPGLLAEARRVAQDLGSDIVPLLQGSLVLAHGTGNSVTPLHAAAPARAALQNLGLVLLKPPVGVSAGGCYAKLQAAEVNPEVDYTARTHETLSQLGLTGARAPNQSEYKQELTVAGSDARSLTPSVAALLGSDPSARWLRALLRNDLSGAAEALAPEIITAQSLLSEGGVDSVLLSGSGSVVVGYCVSRRKASEVRTRIEASLPHGWWTSEGSLRV